MTEIELETIKLRFDGVRQAIARSRFTFLVSVIASVAILVTVWNARMSPDSGFALQPYWSYDRGFTAEMQKQRLQNPPEERKIPPEKITEVTDQVQQEVVSEWVKNQVVSVGLLGIRISVADFSVLGSLSLLIASIWLFFSVRSENLSIGNLLTHAYKFPGWDDRYLVYQGIVNYAVFSELGRGDKPITDFKKVQPQEARNVPLVRGAMRLLIFLPAITTLIIVAADMWTLFRRHSLFSPSHSSLWKVLDRSDLTWFLVSDAFALILLVGIVVICWEILSFTNANSLLLRGFKAELVRCWRPKVEPTEFRTFELHLE